MKKSYKTPLATRTRMLSVYYRRIGRLVARPCYFCGATKVEMHHLDYRKPELVVFLCKRDHMRLHRLMDKIPRRSKNSGATD